jgi:ANTAR domain
MASVSGGDVAAAEASATPRGAGAAVAHSRPRWRFPPPANAEFEALEAEVDRAQQALEDRKLVERAKGLLMAALDLSEQDAFRRLQLTARERNLRLAEVAARIVEQQPLLEPKRKRSAAH